MLPRLKFYDRRDVFSFILKLQTMTFNNQKKITFLDNLIMIKWSDEVRQTNIWTFNNQKKITFLDNLIMIKWSDEVRQTNIWSDEEFSLEGESQKY